MLTDIGGFISAPIKLAAMIDTRRRRIVGQRAQESALEQRGAGGKAGQQLGWSRAINSAAITLQTLSRNLRPRTCSPGHHPKQLLVPKAQLRSLLWLSCLLSLIVMAMSQAYLALAGQQQSLLPASADQNQNQINELRHKAHYLNMMPSAQFNYNEGRQSPASGIVHESPGEEAAAANYPRITSHIYKRSSALLSSGLSASQQHYPPLVSSQQQALGSPLRRRMMSEAAAHSRWTAPQMLTNADQTSERSASGEELELAEQVTHVQVQPDAQQQQQQQQQQQHQQQQQNSDKPQQAEKSSNSKRERNEAAELLLLKQKQHIQYHDQWPSLAGKCHKRTLNFCASVLPFNTTTFPNIIGDTNRFEVKRSLPFFGFLAKSSCNKRLDELLCLLLEPPCAPNSGVAIPPCKKFCRLALEGCNEYIPATLAMSSVFDCRQYPDSNDPNVCINLAQGSRCEPDEFKCPDKTCIPRNWLCDGVRDCIFAADEANCTALTGIGLQTSVCSTEEFKCDGKCVPKAWKCDGERDCLDGTDEESCDQRPRCGPDRFRCADGNGCLPKRWVCDGKAECRDGSDETNCDQRQCSESDFKCDNGICIPKLWRCDRQFDCKDGSDERGCIYPTTATPTTSSTTGSPAATFPTATIQLGGETNSNSNSNTSARLQQPATGGSDELQSSQSIIQQGVDGQMSQPVNYYASSELAQPQQQQQSDSSLLMSEDVARIIRQESIAAASASAIDQKQTSSAIASFSSANLDPADSGSSSGGQKQHLAAKELKKFDYDIIQSPPPPPPPSTIAAFSSSSSPGQQQVVAESLAPTEPTGAHQQQQQQAQPQQMITQIEFVPHQQVSFPAARQVTPPAGEHFNSQQPPSRPTFPAPQVMANERVPIYRSLFKTLKGNQGRVPAGMSGAYHRVAVGRRRRERNPLAMQQQQQPAQMYQRHQQPPDGSHMVHPASPAGGQQYHQMTTQFATEHEQNRSPGPAWTVAAASSDAISSSAPQAMIGNYTAVTQPARSQHGVASYLQLLNARYNLRLPRVSPIPV